MNADTLLAHKLRNNLQSAGLLITLSLMLGYLAWTLGGVTFAWSALLGVVLLFLANPAASPRLVMSMYGGRQIRPGELPRLDAAVTELARRAGLASVPRLFYLPSPVMNAFATGHKDDAVIALSDALLRRLDLRELVGVLSHELSHIANGDIRVMGFADLVSRITGLLSTIGQLMLLVSLPILLLGGEAPPLLPMLVLIAAPTISSLVQLALSRNRELEADRSAAELTGDPEGLARALAKLDRYQGSYWEQLVMPGRNIPEPSVLRTHPPVEERVRRLMALAPDRAPTRPVPLGRRGEERYNVAANGRSTPARPRWHISGLWY